MASERSPVFLNTGQHLNHALALFLSAGLCFSCPVWSGEVASPSPDLESLSIKGFVWSGMQSITANGVPLQIRPFRSAHAVTEAARLLAERTDLFQRMLTMPGLIRLSGFTEDRHWLAEIQATPDGVVGRVSSLSAIDKSSTKALARHRAEPLLSWLAPSSRRLLHHRENEAGLSGPERFIYAIALQADALAARMATHLAAQGWVCAQGCSGVRRRQVWQRDKANLFVFIQAAATGSLMYLHIE